MKLYFSILGSKYWVVAYYTVLCCLISGLLAPIASAVITGSPAHWIPFAVLIAFCLSVIGYLWLRVTIAVECERVGLAATAFAYNAGYRDCYNDDEYQRATHLAIIDLSEAIEEAQK